MPAVKTVAPERKATDFKIDARVSIALDALSEKQKKSVGGLLSDRAHFVAGMANRRKNRKVSVSEPVYALSASPGLNIIYKLSGDDIEVLDLMGDATLQRFAPKGRGVKEKKEK